jgi:hypothetical protein
VINAMPELRFDVLWRGAGPSEALIATFTHSYPAGTAAQFEADAQGDRVAAKPNDLLVLRATMLSTDTNAAWVPIAEHPSTPTARMTTLDVP